MFDNDLFMVISTVAYVDHEELTETSEVVATGQVMVFLGDHFVITVRRGEHAQLSAPAPLAGGGPGAAGPRAVGGALRDRRQDHRRLPATWSPSSRRTRRGGDQRVLPAGPARGGAGLPAEAGADRVQALGDAAGCAAAAAGHPGATGHPAGGKAYFRELADHHTEAREAVASFDEVLTSILQAGLARASVADNEDMRKISGWVAIVAVPTMIAGIYGMNFGNMPELGTRYGYFVVLGLIAAVMIGLYIGFKRNKWL